MIVAVAREEDFRADRWMTEKEKSLLRRCCDGEKAAWDELVGQYSGLIYHTIRRTLASHHTDPASDRVDDIFQEVFVSLVKNNFAGLRRFRGDRGCTLASWLRMIAARRTIDYLRQTRDHASPFEDLTRCEHSASTEILVDFEKQKLLLEAIEALPARDRILIELFFRRGLLANEVASILQTSVGAVYTHKSRILAKLRAILERTGCL